MIYLVSRNRATLVCQYYDGGFVLDTDTDFFVDLASRLGFEFCNVCGSIQEAFPNSEDHPDMPSYFKCVPGAYIESDLVDPSDWWGVPFFNDKIYKRYLKPVAGHPGLMVPSMYSKYIKEEQFGEVGMETNFPCGLLDGVRISTFPAFLPVPELFENVTLSYRQGIMCLSPLLGVKGLSKSIRSIGLERFILPTQDIQNLEDEVVSYRLDDKFSMVFYLPNMDSGGEGVYYVHGMAGMRDGRGIGVDTNIGEILTC